MFTSEAPWYGSHRRLNDAGPALGLPSMGSWITYGLGSDNQNLPGYVVVAGGRGTSGSSTLWQSGFLSSSYAGVLFRTRGEPVLNLGDHHEDVDGELPFYTGTVDQPITALIKDFMQRGLLDETLVVIGSEFGRTPLGQGKAGRDHHPFAFTMLFAGGGMKAGCTYGETDEIGWAPICAVHVNDLHATLLHLFGLDHLRLTYRFKGLDQRLTPVTREADAIDELFA